MRWRRLFRSWNETEPSPELLAQTVPLRSFCSITSHFPLKGISKGLRFHRLNARARESQRRPRHENCPRTVGVREAAEKRRTYYRDTYLTSDDWKRKRGPGLKRDKYGCVYCGARATQVHHKRYARRNIGSEPIEWLVAVCKPCHERQHERE